MQVAQQLAVAVRELALQQVAQQVVVAEPDPAVVEGDQEQVRAVGLGEQRAGVVVAGDRGAQRRAHPLEDRRAQQEVAQLR